MEPERENGLVDLLDRLVNKGLILNADLIISVAGVPLLGVSLKAALASIETMLDYGMMEAWDQSTREWYTREYADKRSPLAEGEELLLKTFGSLWYSQGIISTWRPGFWYLTDRRLILWRAEPAETLFEVHLENIEGVMVNRELHFKKMREEVHLQFDCGEVARIHVSNTTELKEALEGAAGRPLEMNLSIPCEYALLPEGEEIILEKRLWYLFPAQGILGETWRPGSLCITNRRLYWTYKQDDQKIFEMPIGNVTGTTIQGGGLGINRENEKILAVAYGDEVAHFSGKEETLYDIKTEMERRSNFEKVLIA
nr:MAG: gas vesicle protein [Methanothrix sp.]